MQSHSPQSRHDRRRPRPDWWLYPVALLLGIQIVLYVVPHRWPGPLGLAFWLFGSDRLLWLFIGGTLLLIAIGFSLWRRPFWSFWRVIGLISILALIASPYMYRIYPSSHDDKPSEIRFRVPLDGPVLVGWGGATPDVNYHVMAPDQRWAYDLLVAKNGKTHAGDGAELRDYYCYGQPVLAPAAGRVVSVLDGLPDQPPGVLGGEPAGGNQIVIDVAPHQFLFLCHLLRGSITVAEGDQVTAGQHVAKVGNSGNTSEPHLHIHLQDTPDLHLGEGIPLYFHRYRKSGQIIDRGIPTGGLTRTGSTGQIIEHVPE